MSRLMKNYGWVQNTSNLSTIRDTIDLVPDNGITHDQLRTAIKVFREERNELPKRWTWDARCRIKAIHAVGLVSLNRRIRGYELTELGQRLKQARYSELFERGHRLLSDEEKAIFRDGLLTNPPVIRVLTLLQKNMRGDNQGLSKYDVGAELGFVGDVGFTHYDPYWIVNNGQSFTNKEGDADKWGRTILSWLRQVGWVEAAESLDVEGKSLPRYRGTPEIENVLRYSVNRILRNVPIEMLCSDHHTFPKLIQKRRCIMLQLLGSNQPTTKAQIVGKLEENGINADFTIVDFEIINLRQAGFRITSDGGYYMLQDRLNLDIPPIGETEKGENKIEKIIEENVVKFEGNIPARFIDGLIRYGYDGAKNNEFESTVSEYFRYLGYNTTQLGQGRGRVTDVIARYIHPTIYARSYGIIIDAKATSADYTFPAGDKRKMVEYIQKHGPELLAEKISKHAFSFVSSSFGNNVSNHLNEITTNTDIKGTAINVLTLLELGKRLKEQRIDISSFYDSLTTNREMVLD